MDLLEDLPVVVQLVLLAFAAARIVTLIVEDTIADRPRGWLLDRVKDHEQLVTLVSCPRCVGWWVSLLLYGAWLVADGVTLVIAGPWAVAQVAWWAGGVWLPEED